MSCPHVHKDAPENTLCEDCYPSQKKLKTLKDMVHIKVDRLRFDKSYEGDFYLSDCISEEELKQEAIKWVKEGRNEPDYSDDLYLDGFVILWIKHFFNITEEELK